MAKNSPSSMLVPGDFEVATSAIQRRRSLLDAMVKQLEPGEGKMVSGHYIPPSGLSGIASLLGDYVNRTKQKDLDAEEAAAKDQYQTGLGDAVKTYMNTKNGMEKPTSMTQVTEDGSVGAPMMEQIPGDPKKAMLDAITSQYKPMQQLGMAELTQQGKQQMTAKDIFALAGEGKFTPESVQRAAIALDPHLMKPFGKTHIVNGQMVSVGEGDGPKMLGDYRDKFGNIEAMGQGNTGPIMGQRNLGTGEAKFAPSGTTVNVNTAQKGADAFATAMGGEVAKALPVSKEVAMKAQASLPALQNAAALVKELPGGVTAQPVLYAKRVLGALGGDTTDVTSAEQVAMSLKEALMSQAKMLGSGSGFSNQDLKFLEDMNGSNLASSPQTLQYIVNKLQAGSMNAILSHRDLVNQASQMEGSNPAVMKTFEVPMPHFSLPGSEFSFDEGTKRFSAKGAGAKKVESAAASSAISESRPLSQVEQQELAAFRAKYGKGGK